MQTCATHANRRLHFVMMLLAAGLLALGVNALSAQSANAVSLISTSEAPAAADAEFDDPVQHVLSLMPGPLSYSQIVFIENNVALPGLDPTDVGGDVEESAGSSDDLSDDNQDQFVFPSSETPGAPAF
jgi:hypothetical protein